MEDDMIKGDGIHVKFDENDMSKVYLQFDPNCPEKVFDEINWIEINLVKKARNNLNLIKKVSIWSDSLRENVRQQLADMGIPIEK